MSLTPVMHLSQALIQGLGLFYQHRNIRTSVIAYKEQQYLYYFTIVKYIVAFSCIASSTIKHKWVSLKWGSTICFYGLSISLYVIACCVARFQRIDSVFQQWHARYDLSDDRGDSFGDFVITKKLVKLIEFKNHFDIKEKGVALLAQQINDKYAQHLKGLNVKTTLCTLFDFGYMHIPDVGIAMILISSLSECIFGTNKVMHGFKASCCIWAIAEQGVFWMKPLENNGPLFRFRKGVIVRKYNPVIRVVNIVVTPFFLFLYSGIVGKISIAMTALSYLSSRSEYLKRKRDDLQNVLFGMLASTLKRWTEYMCANDLIEPLTPQKEPESDVQFYHVRPTARLLQPCVIRDPNPEKSVLDMKKLCKRGVECYVKDKEKASQLCGIFDRILHCIQSDEASKNRLLSTKTKRGLLAKWFFYICQKSWQEDQRQNRGFDDSRSEIQKLITYILSQDWHACDLACEDEMQNFYLTHAIYFMKEERSKVSDWEKQRIVMDYKLQLFLQNYRELLFIDMIDETKSLMRKEKNTSTNPLRKFFFFIFEKSYTITANRHYMNMLKVMYAPRFGLILQQDDMVQETTDSILFFFMQFVYAFFINFMNRQLRITYLNGYLPNIAEGFLEPGDGRLTLENDLFNYMHAKIQDMISEKEHALSESHEGNPKLKYELDELKRQETELYEQRERLGENKPTITREGIVGNAEQYQRLTKEMLLRYLPIILEDLQFIRVKGISEGTFLSMPTKRAAMNHYLKKCVPILRTG